MIDLLWPLALCLLIVPFFLKPRNVEKGQGTTLFFPALAHHHADNKSSHKTTRKRNLLTLWCWALLIIALAQPVWLGEPITISKQGRDIVLAIDLSASMAHEDFEHSGQQINRLQAVKLITQDFIRERQGDRFALVLFGRQAYLYVPFTHDLNTVAQMLLETEIGLAGKDTAMGDAIGLAIKKIEQESNHKVIVLMTDGTNTAGKVDPVQASLVAKDRNIKIHTIGIGNDFTMVNGLFGSRRVPLGNEIDEKTLKTISNNTGGIFQRAKNLQQFDKIYDKLNELEPVDTDELRIQPQHNLFYWPLALFLITLFVAKRRFD